MKKSLDITLLIFIAASVLLISGSRALADAGPKPSVTILVENPPEDVYYLDLLVPYEGEYSNIDDESRGDLDPGMLASLESYDNDGWYAALAGGTNAPLFGDLTGQQEGSVIKHRFTYMIPDRFKLIIVTAQGEVRVSNEITTRVFNETIYVDFDDMSLRRVDPGYLTYVRQFAGTFIPTILIEGLLLLIFGFSLRKNWKVFLLLNLLTQIILTAAMSVTLINFGMTASYFIFVPAEAVIILIEAIVLTKMLKEHRTSRRLIYALTANLASAAAGVLLIPLWFNNIFI